MINNKNIYNTYKLPKNILYAKKGNKTVKYFQEDKKINHLKEMEEF